MFRLRALATKKGETDPAAAEYRHAVEQLSEQRPGTYEPKFTLEQYRPWHSKGVGAAEAAAFYDTNPEITLDEALDWKIGGIDGWEYPYFYSGETSDHFDDIHTAIRWFGEGIRGEEHLHFRRAGVQTVEEAQVWIDAGIRGDECLSFIRAGVQTVEEARVWVDAEIRGDECHAFHGWDFFDNPTPDAAYSWINVGVRGHEYWWFRQARIRNPTQARQWMDVGVRGQECFDFFDAEVYTPLEAAEWKRVGVDGWRVHACKFAGIEEPLAAAVFAAETGGLPDTPTAWDVHGVEWPPPPGWAQGPLTFARNLSGKPRKVWLRETFG